MSQPDFNCVSMTAVRFNERVTITVVSSNGTGKRSVTIDADHPLYGSFLEVADDESLWGCPIQPRDAVRS